MEFGTVASLTTTGSITTASGIIAVLRCIDIVFHSGSSSEYFYVKNVAGGFLWYTTHDSSSAIWKQWKGRHAYTAAQPIEFGTSGTVDATFFGYNLTTP